jgi:hypothetical protein
LLSPFLSDGDEDAALGSRRALFVSQLARKHPVAFFQFIDICARSGRIDIQYTGTLFNLAAIGCARVGTKGLADLLSSPAATAALASALCSLLKLTVQHIQEQAAKAAAAAAAADAEEDKALARVLLFSPTLLFTKVLLPLVMAVVPAVEAAVAAAPSSSSSSSSSDSSPNGRQAWASAMFLAVLVLRGFVQVHEAAASVPAAAAAGLAQHATDAPILSIVDARVQQMMVCMLAVFRMAFVLTTDGMRKCRGELAHQQQQQLGTGLVNGRSFSSAAAAAAVESGQGQLAAAAPVQPELHSSSSSSQPVRWRHLLCLHPSRKLMAAIVNFGRAWREDEVASVLYGSQVKPGAMAEGQSLEQAYAAALSKEQLAEMRQLYQDALRLCWTVAAVTPLPVVCNNPGCGELSGVSDAAAARYVCAGCGCRYCSAACQAAGWRSHKKACRRMAAFGLRVERG